MTADDYPPGCGPCGHEAPASVESLDGALVPGQRAGTKVRPVCNRITNHTGAHRCMNANFVTLREWARR